MGKLRIACVGLLFVLGCTAHWEPVSQDQQEVQVSTTYAGNIVFPASITIPSDLDPKPAASVNVGLEGLADRTAYLGDHTFQAGVDRVEIDWFSPHAGLVDKFDSAYQGPPLTMGWLQTDNTGPGFVWLEVGNDLKYYQFQSVLVYVRASGHGALPANLPQITLYRWRDPYTDNDLVALNTPLAGVPDTGADVSASQVAYDAAHFIRIALGSVETIDRRSGAAYPYSRYFLKLEGEHGANSAANSLIFKSGRLAPGLFG